MDGWISDFAETNHGFKKPKIRQSSITNESSTVLNEPLYKRVHVPVYVQASACIHAVNKIEVQDLKIWSVEL